ncbi:MAG: glycosyltransferase family 4 protein, partial [Solirubrobacterales bacterium]
ELTCAGQPSVRAAATRILMPEFAPSTGVTALVLHTDVMSGPALSFAHRLPLTAEPGERIVLAPGTGPATELLQQVARVEVTDFGPLKVPGSILGVARQAVDNLRQTIRFARAFRRLEVDTVICSSTSTPAALLAAKLTRKSAVVYCGELLIQSQDPRRLKRVFAHVVLRFTSLLADAIICCSDHARRQFPESAATSTVYPSIEISTLKELRSASPPGRRPKTIATIGSLSRARGQDDAIRAFAHVIRSHPDARLVVAGEPAGPADQAFLKELRALAKSLDLGHAVEFPGHVDVPDLLAKVRVVTSCARLDEAFGRVSFEALAAGCGVVATDTGGTGELLTSGREVILTRPDDPEAIASAIARLLSDEALVSEMTEAADGVLESVDQPRTDKSYLEAIGKVRAGAGLA